MNLVYWRVRMLGKDLGSRLFSLAIGLLGLYGLLVTGSRGALGANLFSRLDTSIEGSDASVTGQVALVSSAWDMFLDAPLFGAVLEDPAFGIYPQNIIVEAFMTTGIFGGSLFVQYCMAAQFSGAIYTASTAWALLACILGLAYARKVNRAGRRGSQATAYPTRRISISVSTLNDPGKLS